MGIKPWMMRMTMNNKVKAALVQKRKQTFRVRHQAKIGRPWNRVGEFHHMVVYEKKTHASSLGPDRCQIIANCIKVLGGGQAVVHVLFGRRCVVTGRVIGNGKEIRELPGDEVRRRKNITVSPVYQCSKMEIIVT